MKPPLRLQLSCFLAGLFVLGVNWGPYGLRAAEPTELNFDDSQLPSCLEIEGNVHVDRSRNRGDGQGGALSVGPQARVRWNVRDENGSGTVEMWVLDEGKAPADPKKHGTGPLWGLVQKNGSVLVVGPVYAPYLSGDTTYATSDFTPGTDERPWWEVQYLGLRRQPQWHKWTFDFDPEVGLRILYDGKDLNARRQIFKWNKTRLLGFTGVILLGDTTDAQQTLWVDDIKVQPGPPVAVKPLWPPPPPKTLQTLPPPEKRSTDRYAKWSHGPSSDPSYFPIAVWLQSPDNAQRYKQAGINVYVGLWKGPTQQQLDTLTEAGMSVICAQNRVGLQNLDNQTIVGWMHGDEPDNAQSLGRGKGYGPPIAPEKIIANYRRIAAADPTRPVLLNLGQGVAWDGYRGRGVRTNHPEDYLEYAKGCDIVSFDIYPAVHREDTIAGNLWYVANGVSRLRKWTAGQKAVWNCIECTHISNPNTKPTPHQVRAEVWMSIIHGSRGLIYFVHQFQPKSIEAGLLADSEMLAAVTKINHQIHSLASVINSPDILDAYQVESSTVHVPIHFMAKELDGAKYVFAVSMYHLATDATFTIPGLDESSAVQVLAEDRSIPAKKGQFADHFEGYDVHIYRIQ